MMFHKEWARSCMRCHGRKQESLNEGQGFLIMLLAEALVKLSAFWGFPGHIAHVLTNQSN